MKRGVLALGLALGLALVSTGALAASLLPNAEQTFLDGNGDPLAAGQVCLYIPSTLTPKQTWKDAAQTLVNTTPCVALDGAGRAILYGNGTYRQIVKDVNGNLIWDQPTSLGGGSSTILASVPSTSALRALSTESTGSVWRTGITAVGQPVPIAPLLYYSLTTACPGVGDDGGWHVASADGKCWEAQFGSTADLAQWGLDGTGGTDTSVVWNELGSIPGLREVTAPSGVTYKVTSQITPPPLIYDLNGVTVDCSALGNSAKCWTTQGSMGTAVPLVDSGSTCPGSPIAPTISQGDTAVFSCSISGLIPGSIIRISSSDQWLGPPTVFTKGYLIRVLSIDPPVGSGPSTINLQERFPLNMTPGGNPQAQLLTMGEGLVIRGLTLLGSFAGPSGDQVGFLLTEQENFRLENTRTMGFDDAGYLVEYSWGGNLNGASASFGLGTGLGLGFVAYNGSRDITFDGIWCWRNWDCVATGGFSDILSGIKVVNANANGMLKTAFNAHPSIIDYTLANSSCTAASDAQASNNSCLTYNGGGHVTVSGVHATGFSSSVLVLQPTISDPTVTTFSSAIGNTVECITGAGTTVGINFQNDGTSGQMSIVDIGNHVRDCNFSHEIHTAAGSGPIQNVAVHGNIDDSVPSIHSLHITQDAAGAGSITNIDISGNVWGLTNTGAGHEVVFLDAIDAAAIAHVSVGPDTIITGDPTSIYLRTINVAFLTQNIGRWDGGSVTTPVVLSGDTNVVTNGVLPIAPTINGGFGAGATLVDDNGTASFRITVGTGPSASGVVAFPNSPSGNGWRCTATDMTSGVVLPQTGFTISRCTVTGTMTAGDIVLFSTGPF